MTKAFYRDPTNIRLVINNVAVIRCPSYPALTFFLSVALVTFVYYLHGIRITVNSVQADSKLSTTALRPAHSNHSHGCVWRRKIRRFYTMASDNDARLWPPIKTVCSWETKELHRVHPLASFLAGDDAPSIVHCLDNTTILEATEDDVVFGYFRVYLDHFRLLNRFPGKAVFYNPEVYEVSWHSKLPVSAVDNVPARTRSKEPFVVIGPGTGAEMNDLSSPRMRVHVMAIVMHRFFKDKSDQVFQHSKKQFNTKKHFCIYAVSHCIIRRETAAHLLSTKIQPLHVAGKCEGNPEGNPLREGYREWGDELYGHACNCTRLDDDTAAKQIVRVQNNNTWVDGNIRMFNDYRFALVMENSVRDGYMTEKIINAFLGGSIPIYHGTREALDIFNPKAFIFWDPDDPSKALERIAYLEENQTAYDEILYNEPILKDGYHTVDKYFSVAKDIGRGSLRRKVFEKMGYAKTCKNTDNGR